MRKSVFKAGQRVRRTLKKHYFWYHVVHILDLFGPQPKFTVHHSAVLYTALRAATRFKVAGSCCVHGRESKKTRKQQQAGADSTTRSKGQPLQICACINSQVPAGRSPVSMRCIICG